MHYPKISIITPSYNQGNFIEQTITSVLDQGYPNLEYIIIDGGSTDNTVEIIKKYQDRISYWVSEKDKGQTDAINKGFIKATGEIINWINSDDYYYTGALYKIAASFNNPSINVVSGIVTNFIEGGISWDEQLKNQPHSYDFIAKTFNNQCGTFFRKKFWDKYFPIPVSFKFTMDQYLWFNFWLENQPENIVIEDYYVANFRRHADSKTNSSESDINFNTLGKTFFDEHNEIFYNFYKTKDQQKASIIYEYFWKKNTSTINENPFILNSSQYRYSEALFQSYLLVLLKEDYKYGFFGRLKKNIQKINRAILPTEELLWVDSVTKKLRFQFFLSLKRALLSNNKTQSIK